jgi:hypothetical protein
MEENIQITKGGKKEKEEKKKKGKRSSQQGFETPVVSVKSVLELGRV